MRLVLPGLLIAASLAGSASAQAPAATTAPTATPAPAPAAATPPVATPPAATTAAPAAAQPAAPTAEAPPPVPTLPTSGTGFEALNALEKVCVPAVRGQKLDVVAKANGYKFNKREETWSKPLGATDKAHQIVILPQYSNKSACSIELRYPMGQDADVAKALNVWAFVHQPPLDPTANYTQPQDPDGLKRVRRSWENLTQTTSIGLNFSTVRKPDDTQVNPRYDLGTLTYQERTF